PTPSNSCYRQQTLGASGALLTSGPLQNVHGGLLPASPEWSANWVSRYAVPFGRGWSAGVQLALEYQSSQQFAIEQDPGLVQPAYTLVNPSVWVSAAEDRLRLTVFVKNVLDQRYYVSASRGVVADPLAVQAYLPKDAQRYWGASFELHL